MSDVSALFISTRAQLWSIWRCLGVRLVLVHVGWVCGVVCGLLSGLGHTGCYIVHADGGGRVWACSVARHVCPGREGLTYTRVQHCLRCLCECCVCGVCWC